MAIEENAKAAAKNQFTLVLGRAPGEAEPRSEIVAIGIKQLFHGLHATIHHAL